MFDVLFDTSGFFPRWQCGAWTTRLGFIHIISDVIIGISYILIPLSIWVIIRVKRGEVTRQNQAVLWLFVLFIFLCGTTHFVEATLFYYPVYRLSGIMKALTAIVSVITVITLIQVVPKILQITSRENLERIVLERTSELRKANAQLNKLESELQTKIERLSEADKAKDQFLATLGHELRNPLSPVMNIVYTLRRFPDDINAVTNGIDVIERQVVYMTHLVDDLMDLSRIQGNKFHMNLQHVEINSLLQRTVESLRPMIEARYHKLSVHYNPTEVFVYVDSTRMEQVFNNLLTNAIKYTETGGNIWVNLDCNKEHCVIKIRDDGSGIDAELLPHIFTIFTQGERILEKSQGGLGIGLSLVKSIVELSGGSVEAYSKGQGKGSEFIVRLPIAHGVVMENGDDGSAERETLPMKVLVVDDNVDGAESMGMLMHSYGHRVKVLNDGSRVEEVVKSFKPEVILLDIGLPGMDGYQICKKLRMAGFTNLIIVAITGYGQESDKEKSRAAGFNYYMVKPVNPNELRTLLTKLKLEQQTS